MWTTKHKNKECLLLLVVVVPSSKLLRVDRKLSGYGPTTLEGVDPVETKRARNKHDQV